MALPNSRNKTYVASDQVRSADLNDLQDQIIALWLKKHGSVTYTIPMSCAAVNGSVAYQTGHYWEATGTGTVYRGIWLPTGTRLVKAEFYVKQTTTTTQSNSIFELTGTATAGVNVGSQVSNTTTGDKVTTIDDSSPNPLPATMAAGKSYNLLWSTATSGDRLYQVRLTVDYL